MDVPESSTSPAQVPPQKRARDIVGPLDTAAGHSKKLKQKGKQKQVETGAEDYARQWAETGMIGSAQKGKQKQVENAADEHVDMGLEVVRINDVRQAIAVPVRKPEDIARSTRLKNTPPKILEGDDMNKQWRHAQASRSVQCESQHH